MVKLIVIVIVLVLVIVMVKLIVIVLVERGLKVRASQIDDIMIPLSSHR